MRFHAIYWPAFLMAAGLPLPKRIFAHGWLLFENDKMSKSRGNIVRATPIHKVLGTDALRYFLLREVVFGQDGSFSYDALVGRYNSDLANGLGNLASRTLTMINQYRGGVIPASDGNQQIAQTAPRITAIALEVLRQLRILEGARSDLGADRRGRQIHRRAGSLEAAPKTGDAEAKRLDETLYTAAEALRIVTALLAPVLPRIGREDLDAARHARRPSTTSGSTALHWGHLQRRPEASGEIAGGVPARRREGCHRPNEGARRAGSRARRLQLLGKTPEPAPARHGGCAAAKITIDDFAKVDLRVGMVQSTPQRVKGADKLLHLQVDIGEAAAAHHRGRYRRWPTNRKQLVGRKVVIVANLAPRKLRGIESQGMIVAASLRGRHARCWPASSKTCPSARG